MWARDVCFGISNDGNLWVCTANVKVWHYKWQKLQIKQTDATLTSTNTCKHAQSVSSSCLIKRTIVPLALSQSMSVFFLNANDGLSRALASGFSLFISMFVSVLSLRSLSFLLLSCYCDPRTLSLYVTNERPLTTEKTSIPLFSILVDWRNFSIIRLRAVRKSLSPIG